MRQTDNSELIILLLSGNKNNKLNVDQPILYSNYYFVKISQFEKVELLVDYQIELRLLFILCSSSMDCLQNISCNKYDCELCTLTNSFPSFW